MKGYLVEKNSKDPLVSFTLQKFNIYGGPSGDES